jgi:DNA modification methylase
MNKLYYGDNLEIMRKKLKDETVDLCYIDPPFNSNRDYFQIYDKPDGINDKAQAKAFIDTWTWDDDAISGYNQIIHNEGNHFTNEIINLIKGLKIAIGECDLLAYIVSMALRVTEIHRVLKPTGSFYLHCDQTASHYLKLMLDAIFSHKNFQNEIIWKRSSGSGGKSAGHKYTPNHDVLLYYSKSKDHIYNQLYYEITDEWIKKNTFTENGDIWYWSHYGRKEKKLLSDKMGFRMDDIWVDIDSINEGVRGKSERMGYPTQKPEALLRRILETSSNEGDTVLDCYCGCGTAVSVAQELKRNWIGIDITYQSISLIIKRLGDTFGTKVNEDIELDGIPKDMASATALAHKKDDHIRKEFEKWAILTYSNNQAVINEKKGADKGVDGIAYFGTAKNESERIIFQVKSGHVGFDTISKLHSDMEGADAKMAVLITLQEPTKPMRDKANSIGMYHHPLMDRDYKKIQIVTIKDMIENGKRLEMSTSRDVKKSAQHIKEGVQGGMDIEGDLL